MQYKTPQMMCRLQWTLSTGFDATFFLELLGPAGMPRDLVTRLNSETVKIVQRRDVRDWLAQQGMDAEAGTPEQFRCQDQDQDRDRQAYESRTRRGHTAQLAARGYLRRQAPPLQPKRSTLME
ncbi:MAG: hypothetical protein ACXWMY_19160 [Vulcanimicrobiaceae bacterium]